MPELLWDKGGKYWILWERLHEIANPDTGKTFAEILGINHVVSTGVKDADITEIRSILDAANQTTDALPYFDLYHFVVSETDEITAQEIRGAHMGHLLLMDQVKKKAQEINPAFNKLRKVHDNPALGIERPVHHSPSFTKF